MLKIEHIWQTANISTYLNELWKQAGELLAALKSTGKLKLQYNGEKCYIASYCFDADPALAWPARTLTSKAKTVSLNLNLYYQIGALHLTEPTLFLSPPLLVEALSLELRSCPRGRLIMGGPWPSDDASWTTHTQVKNTWVDVGTENDSLQ